LTITEKQVHALCSDIDAAYNNSFLTTYIGWHWNRTDAPLVYGLATGLTVLASNADPGLGAYLGGRVNANLWGIVVGPSGWARKTTAIELGKEIQELVDPSGIAGEPGSVEGLVESLAQSPQLTLYIREFGDFLHRTSGSSYLAPMREKMVDLYEGRTFTQQYSHTSREIVEPRLSVLAAVTPAYLEQYTTQTDWEGGYFGRFVIWPGVPERYLTSTALRPDMRDWLVHRAKAIRATPATMCAGMTPDAQKRWDLWSLAIRNQCLASTDRWVSAAGARIQSYAAKVILLLALDSGMDVSREWSATDMHVALAIRIARMAFDGLAYIVNELAGTRFGRERRTVLRVLHAATKENVTLKQILNESSPRMEKRDAMRVLETLLCEGSVYQTGDGCYSLLPPDGGIFTEL
tara:strand:+ start:1189 stop:2406 length:1218 start_codon:yes stop_codon:yes gene_type:complete